MHRHNNMSEMYVCPFGYTTPHLLFITPVSWIKWKLEGDVKLPHSVSNVFLLSKQETESD